jgi:hypothetical protein
MHDILYIFLLCFLLRAFVQCYMPICIYCECMFKLFVYLRYLSEDVGMIMYLQNPVDVSRQPTT